MKCTVSNTHCDANATTQKKIYYPQPSFSLNVNILIIALMSSSLVTIRLDEFKSFSV